MFQLPDWPLWAVRSFLALASVTVCFAVLQKTVSKGGDDKDKNSVIGERVPKFRSFQRQYLCVYYIIMLADWLQGTNMYTLYSSYGVNISALFITGFSSSLIFGTFIGIFVDKWGRRFSCVLYLLLEIVINLCEHLNNFEVLLVSRVLGGVSTSLLFSAFESWMVSEHRALGFPEEWLADTFSWASFGNGISAIVAGILAQVCADARGEIGPFQAAIFFTVLALLPVLTWRENYGTVAGTFSGGELAAGESKMSASLGMAGVRAIFGDRKIMLVGLVTSLFEGSMYSFVFMWVPSMLNVLQGSPLPTGLVFSCFMCCISLGGLVFASLNSCIGVEYGTLLVFVTGALALVIPVVLDGLAAVFTSFLIFEICVGVFFPCAGYLRSKTIPNDLQGSIMNIFRVPLNIFVIVGTKLTDMYPRSTCFSVVVCWLITGGVLQIVLVSELHKASYADAKRSS